MANQRIPTGIPGLDEILLGGLLPRRTYLLVGRPGSGKTVFSIQWLLEGARHGERTLFLTLTEAAEEIERNMASFGWTLDGVDVVDLTPGDEEPNGGEYEVFAPGEVEQDGIWNAMYDAIKEKRPQRLVIDSVTQLRYLSVDEYQFRTKILRFVRFLSQIGCTSLFLFESSELEGETAVALAVDGLIRLRIEISPSRVIELRSLQIEKFRGSGFISGFHPLRITSDGMHIFPHRIEPIGALHPHREKLSTEIQGLDQLLGGGIEFGTATIISGASGAGKTTLGMTFLTSAIANGQRAILYTFEEAVESLVERSRGIGILLEPMLEAGTLRIVRLNPMEQYPDEFLGLVRTAVEDEGFEVVMVDSLRGYELEMEQFGSALAHISNLIHYLDRQGVTTFLINELEYITGALRVTELGVSHLADNLILLRYVENAGEITRVILCLKKRLGPSAPDLRELRITPQGLQVSAKLQSLTGILSGLAQPSEPG